MHSCATWQLWDIQKQFGVNVKQIIVPLIPVDGLQALPCDHPYTGLTPSWTLGAPGPVDRSCHHMQYVVDRMKLSMSMMSDGKRLVHSWKVMSVSSLRSLPQLILSTSSMATFVKGLTILRKFITISRSPLMMF